MRATPVFPKWYFHQENAFQQEDLEFFDSIITHSNNERKVSLHNGKQAEIDLPNKWPNNIKNKLYAYIDDVCEFYTPEKPAYRINTIWSNVFEDGSFNVPHNHQGSWLSGIIYVKNCYKDNTVFLTERNPITPNKAFQHNVYSPAVKDGDLVLFESDLWHWVPPSNNGRLTIAFNVDLNTYRKEQTILVPEVKIPL